MRRQNYHVKAEIPTTIVEAVSNLIAGNYTLYDETFHCSLLMKLFDEGHDIAAFCAECFIGRTTFFEWIDKYPVFAETYARAREAGKVFYEKMAVEGIHSDCFNTQLWTIIMRNRHDYTADRKVPLKGIDKVKNHNERIGVVNAKLAKGELTAGEAKNFADYVSAAARVDEITQQAKDIEDLQALTKGKN